MAAGLRTEPLRRLFDNYTDCLALDRNYLAETGSEEELDLDRLELFICARSELLAEAEQSFQALEALGAAGSDMEAPDRQTLLRQVVAVLEEMTGLENKLSAFLGERLREMGETLRQLRRVRPVFQRYSHLGGDKVRPGLITRHE
jgi:hypothetical protein